MISNLLWLHDVILWTFNDYNFNVFFASIALPLSCKLFYWQINFHWRLGRRFAAFSKIWQLAILRLLPFILQINFRKRSRSCALCRKEHLFCMEITHLFFQLVVPKVKFIIRSPGIWLLQKIEQMRKIPRNRMNDFQHFSNYGFKGKIWSAYPTCSDSPHYSSSTYQRLKSWSMGSSLWCIMFEFLFSLQ